MKDFAYKCWMILKFILAAASLAIAIGFSFAWNSNPQRFELLLFCLIGIACSISLLTNKL